jgi:hypothetical protein
MKIKEIVSENDSSADTDIASTPKTPEQTKLKGLQAAADRAKDAVKQERKRQTVSKMAQSVSAMNAKPPPQYS